MARKDDDKVICLTTEQLRKAVRDAVHETLLGLGVDASRPLEMQKDFQHLRDWRSATNSVKRRALHVAVGVVMAGMIAAFWLGIKNFISP